MIKSLELHNFKSIKKKHFSLRNLNVLLGLNGQGKSSFIQSLLFLRQSDRLSLGELKLNGGVAGLTNVGTTRDLFYQYASGEDLSIALQFSDGEAYCMKFDYKSDTDIFRQSNYDADTSIKFLEDNKNEALFTNNFQFLDAQRIEPKAINATSYANVYEAQNIGRYGEYTAHYIEARGSENIIFGNLVHPYTDQKDEVTGKTLRDISLINQINLWMGEISPGVNIKTTRVYSDIVLLEYQFLQPSLGFTNKYRPENVGFGISYALHVVTALLSSRPGELIIIENPESHIHPRGQAELGKLIAMTAQNDVQIVIETHSDHVINGIRVAVKEDSIAKDKVILFYFEKIITDNEQFAHVLDIQIDKNGELNEYPKNLLDEWSNQLFKLM